MSLILAKIQLRGMMHTRARGEMDITAVFGTVVPGSSPGGRTVKVIE